MNDFKLLEQPLPFRPRRNSGEITPLATFESASRPGLYAHLVRQGSPTGDALVLMVGNGHAHRTGNQVVEYSTVSAWPVSVVHGVAQMAAVVIAEGVLPNIEDLPDSEVTGKQLKARAEEVGCDLKGITKKADMQAAIREHLGK
jgi:hypothetical protein